MSTNVNLAAMSAEERAAVELDKQRWREANHMITKKKPDEIRILLARMDDGDEKEDLRRRLNVVRRNRMEIKNKA